MKGFVLYSLQKTTYEIIYHNITLETTWAVTILSEYIECYNTMWHTTLNGAQYILIMDAADFKQ